MQILLIQSSDEERNVRPGERFAISVERLITSRANVTRLLINQHDLVAILRKAEHSTRDTPLKVGLTRWMNRPPLTTVTESGATVYPYITRNQ